MTPDRPQLEDWITITEAARATGGSVRTWRRLAKREAETAKACGRTSRARMAGSLQGWEVHRSLDKRLSVCPSRATRNDKAREALLAKYPEHQVTAAYRRFHWMNAWLNACAARRRDGETGRSIAERIIEQAKQTEGDGFRIGWRSLQTWKSSYSKIGPDGRLLGIEGLIDRRCTIAMESPSRSPEAMEYFYSLYHAQNRLSIKMCHEATARRARAERWAWPGSYGATKKWLAAHDNRSVTFLMRRGKDAWCRRFMPYLEIDYNLIQPGELLVTDHHQLDAWVESGGKQLRPWLTAVQDLRSRAIVGWHLGESPHQDAIVAAYRQAFMDFAIPRTLRIDNGRDFTSKLLTGITKRDRDRLKKEYGGDWRRVLKRDAELVDCVDPNWTGVCNELGIELIYAIPYAPWSKGTLERWFGTFEGQCGKTFTTYCGNSAMTKPECLEEIRRGYTKQEKRTLRKKYGKSWKKVAALRFVDTSDVPTMVQARETIGQYIDIYHQTPHTGIGGETPLAVWNTARSIRRADADALQALMEGRGVYKVGGNGVALTIGSTRIAYGRGCPELYAYTGRKVFIRINPADVGYCYAYTADREHRRFIARLESNARIAPNATPEELREAVAEVSRARKIMGQAQRSAGKRMRTVAQELDAQRREQHKSLGATGTDNATANIEVVQTGFEATSTEDRRVCEGPSIDRKRRDRTEAAAALFSRPLEGQSKGKRRKDVGAAFAIPAFEEAETEDGTESGNRREDVLSLIAGNRHERPGT